MRRQKTRNKRHERVRFITYLSPDAVETLKQISKETQKPISSLIEEALRNYFTEQRKEGLGGSEEKYGGNLGNVCGSCGGSDG
jgi:mRNA-degrading endonuclease RelE of RelBE toxin-antitoxin system